MWARKPRRGRNPRAVYAVGKTVAQVAAVVWTGAVRSETDPGSVTVALGRAQFGVQFFSNYSKISQILKFKFAAFPNSKNVENLQAARYELDKHLCPLAKLQNPRRIQVIIFGTTPL
jgi:hypothetical protein